MQLDVGSMDTHLVAMRGERKSSSRAIGRYALGHDPHIPKRSRLSREQYKHFHSVDGHDGSPECAGRGSRTDKVSQSLEYLVD